MKKKILKEDFISNFIGGFLQDIQNGQVQSAIKTAKKKKLPNPVLDQMKEIEDNIKELENFLKTV